MRIVNPPYNAFTISLASTKFVKFVAYSGLFENCCA